MAVGIFQFLASLAKKLFIGLGMRERALLMIVSEPRVPMLSTVYLVHHHGMWNRALPSLLPFIGLETHAVSPRFIVFGHLEVVCTQTKGLEDSISELWPPY